MTGLGYPKKVRKPNPNIKEVVCRRCGEKFNTSVAFVYCEKCCEQMWGEDCL